MAATSVANLIKEFSDKPIPNLEALRQSFQPSSTRIFSTPFSFKV